MNISLDTDKGRHIACHTRPVDGKTTPHCKQNRISLLTTDKIWSCVQEGLDARNDCVTVSGKVPVTQTLTHLLYTRTSDDMLKLVDLTVSTV